MSKVSLNDRGMANTKIIRNRQFAIDKIRQVARLLSTAGIEDAAKEAEEMVCFVLNINRTSLYRDNREINDGQLTEIDSFVGRRLNHEPLQYILGEVEFYGLRLKIGTGVLIPRPETELLVEEAINEISNLKSQISNSYILDLCCGSGCIALSLARSFPDIEVYATDISDDALRYARLNAEMNHIENVFFRKGHLFEPVQGKDFHLIISNPPYIRSKEIETLQAEIRLHEPIEALNGGEDGLVYYREILSRAKDFLYPEGLIMLEIGDKQADGIRKIAKSEGYKKIEFKKDYSQKERIAMVQIPLKERFPTKQE